MEQPQSRRPKCGALRPAVPRGRSQPGSCEFRASRRARSKTTHALDRRKMRPAARLTCSACSPCRVSAPGRFDGRVLGSALVHVGSSVSGLPRREPDSLPRYIARACTSTLGPAVDAGRLWHLQGARAQTKVCVWTWLCYGLLGRDIARAMGRLLAKARAHRSTAPSMAPSSVGVDQWPPSRCVRGKYRRTTTPLAAWCSNSRLGQPVVSRCVPCWLRTPASIRFRTRQHPTPQWTTRPPPNC